MQQRGALRGFTLHPERLFSKLYICIYFIFILLYIHFLKYTKQYLSQRQH